MLQDIGGGGREGEVGGFGFMIPIGFEVVLLMYFVP